MRPTFPKRAVITVGMPYANKGLHFGHIGGVFIPADCYARFLRDRIGPENVLFVSGTDCYGSPIDEGYRKLVEAGAFTGTVLEFVEGNHKQQSQALAAYDISLDIFEGSALGASSKVHERFTAEIIKQLHANGWLTLESTAQFYDAKAASFLNGRQVQGHCPVQGCKSAQAYADECELGHQYRPEDLLNPVSTLSGERPELKEVNNWYFALPSQGTLLREYAAQLKEDPIVRSVVADTIGEFLVAPIIYVKQEFFEHYEALCPELPPHIYRATEKGKASFELEFTSLEERDRARTVLERIEGVRLRTGKALVPFRITGNIAWGVPAPVIADARALTVWCWPESLWAPISFSRCWLEHGGEGVETLNARSCGKIQGTWEDFWCSKDARVYQFIGQDNIYFYGVAQTGMWAALAARPEDTPAAATPQGSIQQSTLVANYHLLYGSTKASSSGAVKPPLAAELLEHYTAEQLRAHFISLGLGKKPVGFKPKAFGIGPQEEKCPDPVLKESALLTNVFNRLARSCFYEAQNTFEGLLPCGEPSATLVASAHDAILAFEQAMYTTELHTAVEVASEFIRQANKFWSEGIKDAGEEPGARRVVLVGAFYLLRVALVLMHSVVPRGTELIFEKMNFACEPEEYFSWDTLFEGNQLFFTASDNERGGHPLCELPPRFDFFQKHPSQL